MPKSKRQSVVSLTKTDKRKTKESKKETIDEIQELLDIKPYVWVLEIEQMRTQYMQDVRKRWQPDRIMLGKIGVMRKAVGTTEEEEYKPGCAAFSEAMKGNIGLLFTTSTPFIVKDWFDSYEQPDYARTGNSASRTVTLPAGQVYLEPGVEASHSLEPQLRKLGMPTRLVKGKVMLENEYTICKEGQELKPEQVNLLKIFNVLMAKFQLKPTVCLNLQTGELIQADEVEPEASEAS